MKFKYLFIIIFVFCFSFLYPSTLNAQAVIPSSQFVDISVFPRNPPPNQQIKVSVESFTEDLSYATIEWGANGQTLSSGVGKTEVITTSPNSGATLSVVARIKLRSGAVITKSIQIRPSSLDILWQPLTYVPPFYQGLPLFTHQSAIMFVAIPSFGSSQLPGFGVNYKWSVNGEVVESSSGYGKNSFVFTDGILSKENLVRVIAQDASGNYTEKSFAILAGSPKLLTYLDNPLLGILYNRALVEKISLPTKEFMLTAVPYYFSDSQIPISWYLNNNKVSGIQNTKLLLKGAGVGESYVKLSASDPIKILQSSNTTFNIVFTEQ